MSSTTVGKSRRDPRAVAGRGEGGPLLLSSSEQLPKRVSDELVRVLAPGATVYLLGGALAISPAVEQQVTALGFTVRRIAGPDRYATSVAVADAVGLPSAVFLARGDDFANALAAGPAAAAAKGVVLLTKGRSLPPVVGGYLAAHGNVPQVTVGGQAAAVVPGARAVAGATRNDTAAEVAKAFFPGARAFGLAGGEGFADALTSVPFLFAANQPLLLTPGAALGEATAAYLTGRDVGHVTVFGGDRAVSEATRQMVGGLVG